MESFGFIDNSLKSCYSCFGCFKCSQLFAGAMMWWSRCITRYAMEPITRLSMWTRKSACVFPSISSVLVSSGNSVFCYFVSERWIAVWSEWVCWGQLGLSTVELCVWDLLWRHSYAQYSESFSLTTWTKAFCQATRRRKHPQMVYLISTAQPVQQPCPLCGFTLSEI